MGSGWMGHISTGVMPFAQHQWKAYDAHCFSEQKDQILIRNDPRGTEQVPCEGEMEEAQAPDDCERRDDCHGVGAGVAAARGGHTEVDELLRGAGAVSWRDDGTRRVGGSAQGLGPTSSRAAVACT